MQAAQALTVIFGKIALNITHTLLETTSKPNTTLFVLEVLCKKTKKRKKSK